MYKVLFIMVCWENRLCMGGGELGEDYLILDYNVLILNDGLRSVKKNKIKNFFCLYRFLFSI